MLPIERIAHLSTARDAALRDFNPAYVGSGSRTKSSDSPHCSGHRGATPPKQLVLIAAERPRVAHRFANGSCASERQPFASTPYCRSGLSISSHGRSERHSAISSPCKGDCDGIGLGHGDDEREFLRLHPGRASARKLAVWPGGAHTGVRPDTADRSEFSIGR